MTDQIDDTLGISNGGSSSKAHNQSSQTETRFKTLLGYGKFISGFGWLLLIIGVILLLFSISDLSDTFGSTEAMFALGGILLGLGLILSGISMVVFGQTVSCFVAIEQNTRATHEIIRSQIVNSESTLTESSQSSVTDHENKDDDVSKDNLFK